MKAEKKASDMTRRELARYIDQSVLKPEFTLGEVRRYIQEGVDQKCKTVCINPLYLDIAREMTRGTETGVCVVADFPFGLSTTEQRVREVEALCAPGGVDDVDIVAHYGLMRSGEWQAVKADIEALARAAHSHGSILKVIFETDALSMADIETATDIACEAGADYVKTSTGFFTGEQQRGAAPEIIELMIKAARGRCKVKGSGGIRTKERFFELIDLGIDRMGIGYRSTPVVLDI